MMRTCNAISIVFCWLSLVTLGYADSFMTGIVPKHKHAQEPNLSYIHYGNIALIDKYNKGDNANIGVLIGEDSIAIIDSGGTSYVADRLLAEIKQMSDLPISHIILTHAHPDHWMGLPVLLSKTDAQLLVSEAFINSLAQRQRQDIAIVKDVFSDNADFVKDYVDFTLDDYAHRIRTIKTSFEIELGKRKISIRVLPISHTNNDIVIWDGANETLWAGDLFFIDHVPTFEADVKGLQASRELIEQYNAKMIVPGHGQVGEDWEQKWNNQWQYFTTLIKTVKGQIKSGLSLQGSIAQAEKAIKENQITKASPWGADWQLLPTFHPRNVSRAYQALEWD